MEELQRKGNLLEFTYNLSAFLTAARSITAYVRDSGKIKNVNRIVRNDDIIFFLKEQRNLTVHKRKLNTSATVNADIESSIVVASKEQIKVELYKEEYDAKKIVFMTEEEPQYNNVSIGNYENLNKVSIDYQFFTEEWKGQEDILSLAEYSLNWLEDFISKYIKVVSK